MYNCDLPGFKYDLTKGGLCVCHTCLDAALSVCDDCIVMFGHRTLSFMNLINS